MDYPRLLRNAMAALQELLPAGWQLSLNGMGPGTIPDLSADLWLTVSGDRGISTEVFVEVKDALTPVQAQRLVHDRQTAVRLSRQEQLSALVVAPWLSRGAQQILREGKIGYLDLTGNAFLRIDHPAVYIRTDGATHDPQPQPRSSNQRALSGPKAGRLVRLLVDAAPPVRASALARAAGLNPGYVARLLTSLEDEGLIYRGLRGIDTVDWQGLLRARAEQVPSLLRPGKGVMLLAPTGIDRLLETVRQHLADQVLVTGSYAAARIAPVTVGGGQLLLYPTGLLDSQPAALADRLEQLAGALVTDRRADVIVLDPADPIAVRWGARHVKGLWHVAPSQLVLDSLSGNGRMPAEGEALLDHLADTEKQWRAHSLSDLGKRYFQGQIIDGVQSPGSPSA